MTAPSVPVGLERTPRLAGRLAAGARRRFVGRRAEIEVFRSALRASEPPFAVLLVHGPGGIGKTALLAEYARLAAGAGGFAVRLDGHDLDPSPAGFLVALGQALGLAEGAPPLEALAQQPPGVLLVDTYEALAPLDAWLRETFLPQLPEQAVVVIAGRDPPDAAWRTDPGWLDLVRVVSLRNLAPEDSSAYLQVRGIPEAQHPAVLAFTHGHPLALALVADLPAAGGEEAFRPEQAADVVRVLLERFVRQVPSDAHRRALEVCARTRVTTQSLLADVLGAAGAPAQFGWLRGLSFVEQGPEGLFPHDLAREVLDADLRWRDPEGFRDLHGRVLRSLVRRVQARTGRDQQRAYFDLVYLSRHNPLMRPYYDWEAMGTTPAEPATPEDVPAILAMVGRHEGEASARIAAHWLGRQPHAFHALRGAGGQLAGFVAALLLEETDEADPADGGADPAVEAACRFVRRNGPLRPGERLMYHRFLMGREGYQDLATITMAAAVASGRWLTTPGLAWSCVALADPDSREEHFVAVGFGRAPEADFEVGGRRYGVFVHDWRVEPPLAWIERKGRLDPAVEPAPEPPGSRSRGPLVVLSQPDFAAAVRRALRDFTRPIALATNPLLRSRVAAGEASGSSDGEPAPATLQALLRAGAETLRGNPRDEKLYRALQRTYFEPAATQERAAEVLGLPFSTYRYHLAGGVARVTEWMWRRELHGPRAASR
jgi:hypothetical protein